MDDRLFVRVGIQENALSAESPKIKRRQAIPWVSIFVLGAIILGCLCCECFILHDPTYMDLQNHSKAPSSEFWFGTDTMGRDIFSMIWYGGRISLFIGFVSTLISTMAAILFGTVSGLAPRWLDRLLMRLIDILISVPSLPIVILIGSLFGRANLLSLSFVIGITSWMSIAKVVRTEVRQIRNSEYIIAAKCMGGGFFHILSKHLTPNFVSSILFMVVMNIRTAIVAESTLSFMGMGLPLDMISWGSMLSLSERAMLSGAWWTIVIPGAFLVITLFCVTSIGHYLRRKMNQKESNL